MWWALRASLLHISPANSGFFRYKKCPPVVIDDVVLFNCFNRKRAVRKRKRKALKGGAS
jgi:hypothetical protein